MICHKTIVRATGDDSPVTNESDILLLRPNCIKEDCSMWNAEKNECGEVSYYKAWGQLYGLQARTLVAMDNFEESTDMTTELLVRIAEKLGVDLRDLNEEESGRG